MGFFSKARPEWWCPGTILVGRKVLYSLSIISSAKHFSPFAFSPFYLLRFAGLLWYENPLAPHLLAT